MAEIIQALEQVVTSDLQGRRRRAAFQSWLDQCRVIHREAEDVVADGCMCLYHIHRSMFRGASKKRSIHIPIGIKGKTIERERPQQMRDAAAPFMEWAAEHWVRDSGSKDQLTTAAGIVGGNKTGAGASWRHLPSEPKPDQFREGPLRGINKDLCLAMGEKPTHNHRRLQQKAKAGLVWVVSQTPGCRTLEVWFKNLLECQRIANALQNPLN